jgi:hypothetical protein
VYTTAHDDSRSRFALTRAYFIFAKPIPTGRTRQIIASSRVQGPRPTPDRAHQGKGGGEV